MNRTIVGFASDANAEWVAHLSCGHRLHVRHKPPFVVHPWVTSEHGRNGMLGEGLDCVRCDRFEIPDTFVVYKRTPEFSETTIPAGLRRDHATKVGVWGRIVVMEGALRYRIDALNYDVELSSGRPGIVLPEVRHSVTPIGSVRFLVEFHRAEPTSPGE